MRMRPMALAVLLAGATLLAGCDRCIDCMCHCARGGDLHLTSHAGFDCGQRCENGPDGCGVGNVVSVACLDNKLVNGKPTSVRCAQAETVPAPARPR